ncbi:MAG: small basic protein [Planctomycetes bacterium]|nr:small basic protein [Planctomycetota bacterium]
MTVDKSLRLRASMTRQKNVLSRAQRIAELTRSGKFKAGDTSPFGLPKVRVLVVKKRAKKKEKKAEEGAVLEAGAAAAAPAAAGAAAGAKPAAAAKGAPKPAAAKGDAKPAAKPAKK